jgi:hypothetical protein
MNPEGSLPSSKGPASGPIPNPCVTYLNKLFSLRQRVVITSPNPQAGGPPLVGWKPLLIEYIRSYPLHLEAVSSIRNPKTRRAFVTGTRIICERMDFQPSNSIHPCLIIIIIFGEEDKLGSYSVWTFLQISHLSPNTFLSAT